MARTLCRSSSSTLSVRSDITMFPAVALRSPATSTPSAYFIARIVVPVVLFPISVTVWAAVDLIARPVETVEAAEALTAAAAAGRVDAPPP